MNEVKVSKRQIIIDTINAGGATIETLAAAAECKYASVMSNFSMLRLMGMHPVKDVMVVQEDETEVLTYRFVTTDEMNQIKADAAAKAGEKKTVSKKSPADRLDAAEKRIVRCEKADKTAAERADKGNTELLNLRAEKAGIELKIAQIELTEALAACPVDVASDGVEDVGPLEEVLGDEQLAE